MHSTPHTKRIPRKSVNSFLFVCFSQVQKLLPNFAVGLKNTPQPLLFVCKKHATTALSIRCYSSRGAYVSVVSAVRFHFLTIIDNYPIFQITSSHACNSLWRAVHRIRFRCGLLDSGAKLIPFYQLTK